MKLPHRGPGRSPGWKRALVHLELERTHLKAINFVFFRRIFIHIFMTGNQFPEDFQELQTPCGAEPYIGRIPILSPNQQHRYGYVIRHIHRHIHVQIDVLGSFSFTVPRFKNNQNAIHVPHQLTTSNYQSVIHDNIGFYNLINIIIQKHNTVRKKYLHYIMILLGIKNVLK